MLRSIFEKKQKKGTGKKKRSFWRFAIAESVLIFLGILLALQVDNWNQNRKDRKLEQVLLSQMLGNLRSDMEDLNLNIQIDSERMRGNQFVLEFLESEIPWYDSLGYHFGRLMGGSIFLNNTSAYQNLESIGLNLVRNDHLRFEITALYTRSYSNLIMVGETGIHLRSNHMAPNIAKELDILEPSYCVPIDVKRLRLNNEFKQYARMNLVHLQISKNTNELTKQEVLDLINLLEIELGIEATESE